MEFTTFFKEEDHVLAKGICDLFLDANPYASHGTAADALYTGVPLLTAPHETMASRVIKPTLPNHAILYRIPSSIQGPMAADLQHAGIVS